MRFDELNYDKYFELLTNNVCDANMSSEEEP